MEKAIKRYFPIFVLPTMIAFTLGFIIPFAEGVYLSFCKFTTVNDAKFIGLSNYGKVFKDSTFVHAFWYTAAFTVVSVILINVLAFAVALLLTKGIKGTNVFRTVFFHAEPDRRYRAWLHLAAALKRHPDEIQPYADVFLHIWFLGTGHSDVLAADRLYDDHLHCRYPEYPGRTDRGSRDRWSH